MSQDYDGTDPIKIAQQAERDLNSDSAKQGQRKNASDSAVDSGVDETVENKFPGAEVTAGPQATGREIPTEHGGIDKNTGKPFKADAFEGVGGPEDKHQRLAEENPGSDQVRENIR